MADEIRSVRLGPDDAPAIVDCIRRVYGETYANETFYDAAELAGRMRTGELCCVGAVRPDGRVVGHMAMSRRAGATSAELGNSAIDPDARGRGLIWKLGAELVAWSIEHGDEAFLDYPTTAHHIMQRQSVQSGWETGLMLGYIPESTDGKVGPRECRQREAATIVYHPYPGRGRRRADQVLPEYASGRILEFAEAAGVDRSWRHGKPPAESSPSSVRLRRFARRGLLRMSVLRVGGDIRRGVDALDAEPYPCLQIDLAMSDPGIDAAVGAALDAGYWFCGWLPGFERADVLRLQRVDRSRTNLEPLLVNPVARSLLQEIPSSRLGVSS